MSRCTTFSCNNEAFNSLEVCEDCLEAAALLSAQNFGVPEWIGCTECGRCFKPEYYVSHLPCEGD